MARHRRGARCSETDDQGVVFGPTGLKDPPAFAIGPNAYRRLVVFQLHWAKVIVMIGSVNDEDARDPEAFASALAYLEPAVESISWY